MTPSEKQKEIAVAFAWYFSASEDLDGHKIYEDWLLTEEGKRLTAEDRSEPEEPIVNILINISKKLDSMDAKFDRFEGRLKGSLFGE